MVANSGAAQDHYHYSRRSRVRRRLASVSEPGAAGLRQSQSNAHVEPSDEPDSGCREVLEEREPRGARHTPKQR